jgi:hypothetical protein
MFDENRQLSKKNYIDIVLVQTALLSEANSTSYSRLSVLKTIPELKPPRYLDHLIKESYFVVLCQWLHDSELRSPCLSTFKTTRFSP